MPFEVDIDVVALDGPASILNDAFAVARDFHARAEGVARIGGNGSGLGLVAAGRYANLLPLALERP